MDESKLELDKAVLCGDCIYSTHSKTVDYAYICQNKHCPCKDRTTYADFGCTYGKHRDSSHQQENVKEGG